jgi:hypothetical protein
LRFLKFLFQFHDTGEMGRNPGGKSIRKGLGGGEQLPDKERGKKKGKKHRRERG